VSDRRAAAILTVSDGVSGGTRADESGDEAERLLRDAGFDPVDRSLVPDERTEIGSALRSLVASHAVVVTTGGTGFGPRDVTPEATRDVVEREAPGLAELMRSVGLAKTPMASLSRAVAGSVGAALVLNLPGSP
jgi:molybdopterin adenylyltransferase